MNLVPKEILMSHLQRSEGAEEVSLPIDFFRDLLYQAMPRCQDLIDEAVKAERERMTVVAMNAAEKAVDVAIKLEREACAKLLETTDLGGLKDNPAMQSWVAEMLLAYVKAIRARGQA
jgi:hypothetical protein